MGRNYIGHNYLGLQTLVCMHAHVCTHVCAHVCALVYTLVRTHVYTLLPRHVYKHVFAACSDGSAECTGDLQLPGQIVQTKETMLAAKPLASDPVAANPSESASPSSVAAATTIAAAAALRPQHPLTHIQYI